MNWWRIVACSEAGFLAGYFWTPWLARKAKVLARWYLKEF